LTTSFPCLIDMAAMRGRFAPSPTGYIHLGNVWTALLGWLQVRRAGGTLVLRLEDIDTQRSKPEYAKALLEDLHWLGLDWDEGPDCGGPCGPYVQKQRYEHYDEALQILQQKRLLYPCYCTRARLQAVAGAPHEGEHHLYDQHCYGLSERERAAMGRTPSWRIHVPSETICFVDGLYGRQEATLSRSCGDYVVRRSDGMYAYQLAVSVDDAAMGITHVLRGRDLLDSTPQQIWLIGLLGAEAPQYMHVPMLLDRQGHRISKRQQGITVRQLREQGLTAAQILSYLAYAGGLLERFGEFTPQQLVRRCQWERLSVHDITLPEDVFQVIYSLSQQK